MARYYTRVMRVTFLGQVGRLYRAVAAAVDVPPGATVVELGCGPATLTPHLRSALDPARASSASTSPARCWRARVRGPSATAGAT